MSELRLYVGRKPTGVTLFRDSEWPGMWRIRDKKGRVSDMINLTRAKDASIGWWRVKGLAAHEVPSWRVRQTARGRPPVRPNGKGV